MRKWYAWSIPVLGGVMVALMAEGAGLLKVGTLAPEFVATLSSGETIRLSDYREKKNVVLYFYPKDFTAGCTKQACSFRDNYSELSKYDAVILGVSTDDVSSHVAFARKYMLPFPLISDSSNNLASLYGVTRLGGLLPNKRALYLIDKRGIVRDVIHHEWRFDKHVEDVVAALKGL